MRKQNLQHPKQQWLVRARGKEAHEKWEAAEAEPGGNTIMEYKGEQISLRKEIKEPAHDKNIEIYT